MHRHVAGTVHGAHRSGDHRIRSTTNVAAPLLSTPQVGTASNSNICSMTWRSPPPVACLKQRQLTALHHVDIVFEGWTATCHITNANGSSRTSSTRASAQEASGRPCDKQVSSWRHFCCHTVTCFSTTSTTAAAATTRLPTGTPLERKSAMLFGHGCDLQAFRIERPLCTALTSGPTQ